MRLSNSKTRTETGFEYVIRGIGVVTPFGIRQLKEATPFFPGEEAALDRELGRVEAMLRIEASSSEKLTILRELFQEMKDNSFTIERSEKSVLSVVELFEIKAFLLQCKSVSELCGALAEPLPEAFELLDTTELLDVLDPSKERLNTFYLYDAFSNRLGTLREEKRQLERSVRSAQKEIRCKVEAAYGITMTPKFEYLVAKSDTLRYQEATRIPELALSGEDYMTAVFKIRSSDEINLMKRKMEALNEAIEEEELSVREALSKKIAVFRTTLAENCQRLGTLDLTLAKARYARIHQCVKPTIVADHRIQIEEGRQLQVEEILASKGKHYRPVSINLQEGVTCITGANMGGKTVSLKLAGLCALLTQYGYFVPCASATVGLSSYIHILIGDSQNLQRGLSSFGSEMEELKDILEQSGQRSLLLIDELASGTNPAEGMALTKSLVVFLKDKPFITLLTTHYDKVAEAGALRNLQVRGLADADFRKLVGEINRANRRERIEIIGKYMDYRLFEVENEREIPKDALNIAKMLGIRDEIIEQAKKYMEDREDEK